LYTPCVCIPDVVAVSFDRSIQTISLLVAVYILSVNEDTSMRIATGL